MQNNNYLSDPQSARLLLFILIFILGATFSSSKTTKSSSSPSSRLIIQQTDEQQQQPLEPDIETHHHTHQAPIEPSSLHSPVAVAEPTPKCLISLQDAQSHYEDYSTAAWLANDPLSEWNLDSVFSTMMKYLVLEHQPQHMDHQHQIDDDDGNQEMVVSDEMHQYEPGYGGELVHYNLWSSVGENHDINEGQRDAERTSDKQYRWSWNKASLPYVNFNNIGAGGQKGVHSTTAQQHQAQWAVDGSHLLQPANQQQQQRTTNPATNMDNLGLVQHSHQATLGANSPNEHHHQQLVDVESAKKATANQLQQGSLAAMEEPERRNLFDADGNELDQQQRLQLQLADPFMVHIETGTLDRSLDNQQRQWSAELLGRQQMTTERNPEIQPMPSGSERFRNSLLKAAEVAQQLEARQLQKPEQSSDGGGGGMDMVTRQVRPADHQERNVDDTGGIMDPLLSFRRLRVETTLAAGSNGSGSSSSSRQTELEPTYLGPGQVQFVEPFNGNGRAQARLSCQFDDPNLKSQTISNVEWARFVGNYAPNQTNGLPSFECPPPACRLEPVRTDVTTTIHPRPKVQGHFNQLAPPSYSLTLHELENRHQVGAYRCSAMRESPDGKSELVYRIVSLE